MKENKGEKKEKLIIIGAGEQARVCSNILKKTYHIVGHLDDDKTKEGVIGSYAEHEKFLSDHLFFIAIGDNLVRARIYKELKEKGAQFVRAIHEKAYIEADAELGENIFIGAYTYINIGSQIGDNTYINNGGIIEHDNNIGSHVHLAPRVITGGGVTINDYTFIGLGTVINDHLLIGYNVIVGSGGVVIQNIPDNSVAVGIPAKVIKENTRQPEPL